MNDRKKIETIINTVWRGCDIVRGRNNPVRFKAPVLSLFLFKFISDFYTFKQSFYTKKYNNDVIRVQRALSRERFILPTVEIQNKENHETEGVLVHFDALYQRRSRADIGELINIFLAHLEQANQPKLFGIFRHLDFSSEADFGRSQQRNVRLKKYLEHLNRLDLRPASENHEKEIAEAFDGLIERFAAFAGKNAGGFRTPSGVCELLVRLMAPKIGACICDPFCGSGTLLIKAHTCSGQEIDGPTWALCKMNLLIHDLEDARIVCEDVLRHPQFIDAQGALMAFDFVIGVPPFGSGDWGQSMAATDLFNRFYRGIPPKSKGDWAFIAHMLAIAKADCGRVAVIMPHGVLFRGGQEGKIRETVIRENLLSGVIGLPPNLFYGTDIQSALMIFDKYRPPAGKSDVLFIDASRYYAQRPNHNYLRPQDIDKIVSTYHQRQAVADFTRRVAYDEIERNAFNLNIPLYIDRFERKEHADIRMIQKEINTITKALARTRNQIQALFQSLGFIEPTPLEQPTSDAAFNGRLAAENEPGKQTSAVQNKDKHSGKNSC